MRPIDPTTPPAEALSPGESPLPRGADGGPTPDRVDPRPDDRAAPTAPAGLPVRRVYRRAGV